MCMDNLYLCQYRHKCFLKCVSLFQIENSTDSRRPGLLGVHHLISDIGLDADVALRFAAEGEMAEATIPKVTIRT